MPEFRYSVVNAAGQRLNGFIEAENEDICRKMIAQRGLFCLQVSPVGIASRSLNIGGKFRPKLKELSLFCRQFASMLSAGIGVIKSLDILYQQTEKPKMKQVIKRVYENVQKGQSFSAALKAVDAFPALMVNMTEAGEASGTIDSVMERLALHYEKSMKTANKAKSALMYPAILAVLTILVTAILMVFVMPVFTRMFETSGIPLPLATRILVAISDSLTGYAHIYAFVIITGIIFWMNFLRNEKGRLAWDKFKTTMPVAGKLNVTMISARFARTMSVMIQSGISLLKALEISSKVIGNKFFENSLDEVHEDIRKGSSLSHAMKKAAIFPVMLISMISIGEEAGMLDDVLEKTAAFYDEEGDRAAMKLTGMLEPLMIVIMALIVGFVVVSIIMPMYSMMQPGA